MKERSTEQCIVNRMQDLRGMDLTRPEDYRLALQLKEILLNHIPCGLQMSRHHKRYRSEGGKDTEENLVDCCMGHQKFIHSSQVWEGVDFSFLRNLKERRKHGKRKSH